MEVGWVLDGEGFAALRRGMRGGGGIDHRPQSGVVEVLVVDDDRVRHLRRVRVLNWEILVIEEGNKFLGFWCEIQIWELAMVTKKMKLGEEHAGIAI